MYPATIEQTNLGTDEAGMSFRGRITWQIVKALMDAETPTQYDYDLTTYRVRKCGVTTDGVPLYLIGECEGSEPMTVYLTLNNPLVLGTWDIIVTILEGMVAPNYAHDYAFDARLVAIGNNWLRLCCGVSYMGMMHTGEMIYQDTLTGAWLEPNDMLGFAWKLI